MSTENQTHIDPENLVAPMSARATHAYVFHRSDQGRWHVARPQLSMLWRFPGRILNDPECSPPRSGAGTAPKQWHKTERLPQTP